MKRLLLFTALGAAALSAHDAHAGLVARNLDGNTSTAEAYHDNALNITWLRDANHLAGVAPGMAASGLANWNTASAAVVWLNSNGGAANYGHTGWRLPNADGVHTIGGAGCQYGFNGSTDCGSNVGTGSSELAHLFHATLGNLSQRDAIGAARAGSAGVDFGLVNDDDFDNLMPGRYWSGTASYRLIFGMPLNGIVSFDFGDGSQSVFAPTSGSQAYAWLVHDGDIGTAVVNDVPEPSGFLLAWLGVLLAATPWPRGAPRATTARP